MDLLFLQYLDGYVLSITLIVTVIILYTIKLFQFYSGTPPGPWGIPILGYLPFLSNAPNEDFVQLAKKYGNVFSFSCGSRYVVVINGLEANKQGLLKFPALDGRPQDVVEHEFSSHKSVVVTDGNLWRTQKTFLLRAMRDFGSGKSPMEDCIHKEAEHSVAKMRQNLGIPTDITMMLKYMTGNIIAYVIFGQRFSDDDKPVTDAVMSMTSLLDQMTMFGIANSFPKIVDYIPDWISGQSYYKNLSNTIYDFVDKLIDEHETTFDKNNLRDLIDWYLWKAHETADNENNIFSRGYMRSNIAALFLAGVDTTAVVVTSALRLLAGHPHVQKAVQAELDEVVGRERLPTMRDRPNLPYTEATIQEIHRFISLAAITPYHRATEEVSFNGYRIPRNACVIFNLWSINRSPEVWENPEEFNPERFLDKNRKLKSCTENVIPFLIGKRSCIGEIVARMEIFLFTTALLQNFFFTLPKGEVYKFQPDLYVPVIKSHKTIVCANARK